MALDEPNDNDEIYEVGGFKYAVDKQLMAQANPIKIDFMGMGFKITSNMVLGSGCGGCSSASGGCS